MYLQRLYGSGLGGVDEWREMWNDEVLPYLHSLRPLAGPGTRIEERSDGTLITAIPNAAAAASPAAEAGYSSYFKLTLADTSSGAVVTVADGATGSDSIAVVNGGSTYALPPYSEVVSGARVFMLKYTPAQYGSDGAVVSGATMAISSVAGGTLPSGGTSGAYYYQLGRVVASSGGELRVVQDHTAGVAQFQWFANCFLG